MLFALFVGIYFTMIGTMISQGLNPDSIISFEVFSSGVKPETKKIFEFQILLHRKVNLQSLFAPMGNSTNPPLPSHTRTRTKKQRRGFVFKSPMEKDRCRSAIRTTKRKTMIIRNSLPRFREFFSICEKNKRNSRTFIFILYWNFRVVNMERFSRILIDFGKEK